MLYAENLPSVLIKKRRPIGLHHVDFLFEQLASAQRGILKNGHVVVQLGVKRPDADVAQCDGIDPHEQVPVMDCLKRSAFSVPCFISSTLCVLRFYKTVSFLKIIDASNRNMSATRYPPVSAMKLNFEALKKTITLAVEMAPFEAV